MTDNGPQPVRERIIDISWEVLEEFLRGRLVQVQERVLAPLPHDLKIVRMASPLQGTIAFTVTSPTFPLACPHQTRDRARVVVEEGG